MSSRTWQLRRCIRSFNAVAHRLARVVSGIAFWTGVITPLSYLLFIVPGVRMSGRFSFVLAIVALNYLGLLLGHAHYDHSDRRSPNRSNR